MGSEASPPGTHGIYSARRRVLAGRLHAPVAPFFFSRFVNLGGWSIRFRTFEIPAWGKSNVACSCSCSHHPSASQSAGACSPKPVSCRRPPRAIVIDHSTVQMVWCTHWPTSARGGSSSPTRFCQSSAPSFLQLSSRSVISSAVVFRVQTAFFFDAFECSSTSTRL